MNVCSEVHEEIVYDGKICPLCEAVGKIEDLEVELENALKDIQDLEKEDA